MSPFERAAARSVQSLPPTQPLPRPRRGSNEPGRPPLAGQSGVSPGYVFGPTHVAYSCCLQGHYCNSITRTLSCYSLRKGFGSIVSDSREGVSRQPVSVFRVL